MIEQASHAHFLSRSTGSMLVAAASQAAVAAIPTPPSSTGSAISSSELGHHQTRGSEGVHEPSPIDDDDDDLASRDDDDDDRKYELKIGFAGSITKAEALLSASSSGSNHDKYDSVASSSSPATSTRVHARMRALAGYLMHNFAGLRKRIGAANTGSSVSDVGRMRHYMQRRSAPSAAAAASIDLHKFDVLSTRHSGTSLRTTLSWEDFANDFGADDVLLTTPKSRKRSRSPERDAFAHADVHLLCYECNVPTANVDAVVAMVTASFGTVAFDVLELEALVPENIVVFVGMLVFQRLAFASSLLDLTALPTFLSYVESRYQRDMPFHNAAHAADVLHSLFMLLSTTDMGEKIAPHNQIGALLAAVMHDIEHAGLTNDFLIKTNHAIAQLFPTRAPMEAKHIAVAVDAIAHPQFNILSRMSPAQQDDVRTVVRETILATALCYQRDLLAAVAAVDAREWAPVDASASTILPMPLQLLALRCAMHVSDICQTMKPFAQHEKWVARLTSEHFLQGEEDRRVQAHASPAYCFAETFSRDEFLTCQTGFLKCMALPAVATLNAIPWLDVEQLVTGVQHNIVMWTLECSVDGTCECE